jgi:hypothetical protein
MLNPAHVTQLATLAPDHAVLRLSDSPGGYLSVAEELVTQFDEVRVTGTRCASACVMMLTTHDHVCVERTVQFITFHTVNSLLPVGDGYCLSSVNAARTRAYVATLTPTLQRMLRSLDNGNRTHTISLDDFLEQYPDKLCPS